MSSISVDENIPDIFKYFSEKKLEDGSNQMITKKWCDVCKKHTKHTYLWKGSFPEEYCSYLSTIYVDMPVIDLYKIQWQCDECGYSEKK